MKRRATERRYAILGALHEHGPQRALDLCTRLRRASGTLYPDLAWLEAESLIVGEWEGRDGDRPRRRIYRIAGSGERDQGPRIRRQVEQEIADRLAERLKPRRPWRAARPEGA